MFVLFLLLPAVPFAVLGIALSAARYIYGGFHSVEFIGGVDGVLPASWGVLLSVVVVAALVLFSAFFPRVIPCAVRRGADRLEEFCVLGGHGNVEHFIRPLLFHGDGFGHLQDEVQHGLIRMAVRVEVLDGRQVLRQGAEVELQGGRDELRVDDAAHEVGHGFGYLFADFVVHLAEGAGVAARVVGAAGEFLSADNQVNFVLRCLDKGEMRGLPAAVLGGVDNLQLKGLGRNEPCASVLSVHEDSCLKVRVKLDLCCIHVQYCWGEKE